jgi:hypothetical protein
MAGKSATYFPTILIELAEAAVAGGKPAASHLFPRQNLPAPRLQIPRRII